MLLGRGRDAMMQNIIPVILSGGIWFTVVAVIAAKLPKQFASLIDGGSLFQAAIRRARAVCETEPVIVTSSDYRFIVQKQLYDCELGGQILLEPEGKNTAPAVLAAAHFVKDIHGDALVLVMPSDHHIPDGEAFTKMIYSGCTAATDGGLVIFWCNPR